MSAGPKRLASIAYDLFSYAFARLTDDLAIRCLSSPTPAVLSSAEVVFIGAMAAIPGDWLVHGSAALADVRKRKGFRWRRLVRVVLAKSAFAR